jgi:hypothetical protein
MASLKRASSRVRWPICSRTRMAQISFSFRGAFCPTSFPLFQGIARCNMSRRFHDGLPSVVDDRLTLRHRPMVCVRPEAACDDRQLRGSQAHPQHLGTLSECGYIDAKGPFPSIAALNIYRCTPNNRIDVLSIAGTVGRRRKCQNLSSRREQRARGVRDTNTLDIASCSGPVLQRICLAWEVRSKNINKRGSS